MTEKIELQVVREEFGFTRTTCDCKACQTWCRHQPGFLVPSDLDRLIPAGEDPFVWAEEHLRASPGYMAFVEGQMVIAPSLVPTKKADGDCHWLRDGKCQVHAASPYGCAYLTRTRPAFKCHGGKYYLTGEPRRPRVHRAVRRWRERTV